ncbi:hypothetical protein ACWXWU_01965 [Shewanella sp. A14]
MLIDQAKSTQWHLNDNEYWVLAQLVQHRGQVVPMSTLETVVESGVVAHQLSHTELVNVIYHIIDYLCHRHANLIEYIPEQGVILYPMVQGKHKKILDLPNRLLSWGQFGAIIAALLAVLLFLLSHINPPLFAKADVLRQIVASNGKIIQLSMFDDQYPQDAILHADCLSTQLRLCQHVPWDSVSASISADRHYVSFILTQSGETNWLFRNIKVNVDNMHSPFITQEWLHKVDICG